MNVEYINPFILAGQSVLKTVCNLNVIPGKVSLRKSPYLADQILIVFGVVGKIRGQVCFELSQGISTNIASIMMGGIPVSELDEMSKSAISEMGNMIMGNACAFFGRKSIHVDITPPALLIGKNIEISNNLPTVVIPLILEGYGEITINVSFKETV